MPNEYTVDMFIGLFKYVVFSIYRMKNGTIPRKIEIVPFDI